MHEKFTLHALDLSHLLSIRNGRSSCEGDHHVRDLSQDLGTTPGPKSKPKTKPTAPPDHIIYVIMEDFQQAFIQAKRPPFNHMPGFPQI